MNSISVENLFDQYRLHTLDVEIMTPIIFLNNKAERAAFDALERSSYETIRYTIYNQDRYTLSDRTSPHHLLIDKVNHCAVLTLSTKAVFQKQIAFYLETESHGEEIPILKPCTNRPLKLTIKSSLEKMSALIDDEYYERIDLHNFIVEFERFAKRLPKEKIRLFDEEEQIQLAIYMAICKKEGLTTLKSGDYYFSEPVKRLLRILENEEDSLSILSRIFSSFEDGLFKDKALAFYINIHHEPLSQLYLASKHLSFDTLKKIAKYLTFIRLKEVSLKREETEEILAQIANHVKFLYLHSQPMTLIPPLRECVQLACINCAQLKEIGHILKCTEIFLENCPHLQELGAGPETRLSIHGCPSLITS